MVPLAQCISVDRAGGQQEGLHEVQASNFLVESLAQLIRQPAKHIPAEKVHFTSLNYPQSLVFLPELQNRINHLS